MQKFKTVDSLVNQLKPERPVYCIRKNSIHIASKTFQNSFPGKVLYAVKTNPHEKVIKQILANGIKDFDVASLNEIKLIKKINNSNLILLVVPRHPERFDEVEKIFHENNLEIIRKSKSKTLKK